MDDTRKYRVWITQEGVYIARDKWRGSKPHPEHAIWANGRVRWVRHEEGAICSPYTGPLDKVLIT